MGVKDVCSVKAASNLANGSRTSRRARGLMIRGIDLFCGAGGSSLGARAAGVKIVAAFDMWELAVKTFQDNFPDSKVYHHRLEDIDPAKVHREIGEIDLILASPECTSHSMARGNRKPSEDSRMTALEVVRFAREFLPRWIVIENVVSMRRWARYEEFLERLRTLGYHLREQVLDASAFGVPQARRRLFIICDRMRQPRPTRSARRKKRVARDVISLNGTYPLQPLWRRGRAKQTLQRARRALRTVGLKAPFLLVYYSTDGGGGWQRLGVPLRTVTTLDRFALVKRGGGHRLMRMLQPSELRGAMGFPSSFKLERGTRREKIFLLGNAVCPPVVETIVRALSRRRKLKKSKVAVRGRPRSIR